MSAARPRPPKSKRTLYGDIAITPELAAARGLERSAVGGLVGGIACSQAWADDAWLRKQPYPPEIERKRRPPRPRRSRSGPEPMPRGMVRCNGPCGAFVPRIYLAPLGLCLDCHFELRPDAHPGEGRIGGASILPVAQLRTRK